MTFQINQRPIGDGHPVYLIAEISANHNHDYDKTVRLIDAAHAAGADAVKLQTYTADTLTLDCNKPHFEIQQGTIWDGQTLHQLYADAAMPWDWQPKLKQHADSIGVDLFSSPFDQTAVDFLQSLDVPAYKIASFEIVDTGLLAAVAKTGKPVIVSTGMATLQEIQLAVETLNEHGCTQICLLKCTSAYPAAAESMNLATIAALKQQFNIPIGLSDHTLCHTAAVTAVALGACVIEKHITLSRSDGGPDSSFSLEPDEFAQLVRHVRTAEAAIGRVHFGPNENDAANVAFRRSLFAVADIEVGEVFTPQNVRSIRPGNGLAPKHLPKILNSSAARPIPRGTPLSWDDVDVADSTNPEFPEP